MGALKTGRPVAVDVAEGEDRAKGAALPFRLLLFLPWVTIVPGLLWLRSAWAAILSYHAGMLLAILLRSPRGWRRLRRGWSAKTGLFLVLVGLANGPAFLVLWPWVARPGSGLSGRLSALGLHGGGLALFVLLYVTIHPVLEELFWRDCLPSGARVLSAADLFFASYHVVVLLYFIRWPWALACFLVLAAVSSTWRRIARQQEGLAVPLASHAAAGVGTMAAVLVLAG